MAGRDPGFEVRPQDYGQRGFWITFENGYTVSVQFGHGNYCENRDGTRMASPSAEIAAWNENNNQEWYRPEGWGDNVRGWNTPAQVLEFMIEVSNLPERG